MKPSRPFHLIGALLVMGLGALTGCDRQEPSGAQPALTERVSALGLQPMVPRLDAPEFEIGRSSSQDPLHLWEVQTVAFQQDGGLIVADSRARQLHRFGPEGTHEWSAGGDGSGPGEFRRIDSLGLLPGDTVVVLDSRTGRLSFLAPDGTLARLRPVGVEFGPWPPQVITFENGELGLVTHAVAGLPDLDDDWRLRHDTMVLQMLRRDGVETDTLDRFPGTERASRVLDTGDGRIAIPNPELPFGRRVHMESRGSEVMTVRSDSYMVALRDIRSGAAAEWDLRSLEEPLTPSEISRVAGAERGLAGQTVRELLDSFGTPRLRPSFDGIVIARDGGLWLRRFRDPGGDVEQWWALNRSGTPTGLLTVPESMRLHAVYHDDMAAFVVRNDLGVETVVVTQIERVNTPSR